MDSKNTTAIKNIYDNDQICMNYSGENSLLFNQAPTNPNNIVLYSEQNNNNNNQQMEEIHHNISNFSSQQIGNISNPVMSMDQNYIFIDPNTCQLPDSFYTIPSFYINSQLDGFQSLELTSGNLAIDRNLALIQEMANNEMYASCNSVPPNCHPFKDETINLNGINSLPGIPYVYNMVPHSTGNMSCNIPPQRTTPDINPSIYVNKPPAKLSEAEDWTPNPNKLLDILGELEKLNDIINKLKDECDLPNAKPNLKREKNRLASKACRLKKKVTHETNKIKLEGLEVEFKLLIYALHYISWEIIAYISLPQNRSEKLSVKIGEILKKYLNGIKVAGDSDNFVKNILQHSKEIDSSFILNIAPNMLKSNSPHQEINPATTSQNF